MLIVLIPDQWKIGPTGSRKKAHLTAKQTLRQGLGMQATIRLEQVKAASTGCLHLLAGAAIAGVLLCFACAAFAAEPMNMDEHAHHHAMDMSRVKRSVADYPLPTLQLVRNDGVPVSFPKEIDDGRPVILDFIYTSCTTVCPLTSQVLSEVQNKLSKSSAPVHLVSISIDPEYDTPERLTAYARTYHAGAQWQHYTGTTQASIALQQAFNAYRGDKMNHLPLTFLRAAPGKPWVRLDGLANPDEVVAEYQQLVASK